MTLNDKGNLVIVAGDNEQGKSSLLDSIEMTLHGGASIPPKPVRRGQDKATVELTLGQIGLPELTVKRVITATGGGSLVVTNRDGARLSSPQAVLDALVGKLSFDPLAFAKMKPSDRSETIRQLLGLDFTKQDENRKALFDERTDVNRRVKAKEAQLAGIPMVSGLPAEEQSAAEILTEQEQAAKHNEINAQRRAMLHIEKIESEHAANRVKTATDQLAVTSREIERLNTLLAGQRELLLQLQNESEEKRTSYQKNAKDVEPLKDVDLNPFKSRIFEVETVNHRIRKNKEREAIKADFKAAEKESADLTRKLDAIGSAKRDAIAAAKFPVPGMGMGDSGEVLLDGLPFEQASTKGQLMASLAMGAALNPKLRVMLVRSGNDLDDSALKVLAEWCVDKDYQIWLERIARNGKVAVIIEDGHAVEQTPELLPK